MFDRITSTKFPRAKHVLSSKVEGTLKRAAPMPILINFRLGVSFGVAQDKLCALCARQSPIASLPRT
jgi:hypothetical protein